MLFEQHHLQGKQASLHDFDVAAEQSGFVRWQWEYTRATYDAKFVDTATQDPYFLRVDTRCVAGKLEHPDALLEIRHIYLGRGTFPHGLDYESPVPKVIVEQAHHALQTLQNELTSA